MNFRKIIKLCDDQEHLPVELAKLGLLPAVGEYACPNCSNMMVLQRDSSRTDGVNWICRGKVSIRKQKAKRCETRVGFRKHTFFEGSHLPIWKILGFAHFWVEKASFQLMGVELEMSISTLVNYASYCREVVFDAFFCNPQKIGGPDKIVDIYESKFGRRKYHRGHHIEGQWVFGGYERGSGRVFMVAIESRDSDRLISVIRDWVELGTTIISDFWKANDCLKDEGYIHLKVKHSLHLKEPEHGILTNSLESSWQAAKSSVLSSGRIKAHVPGNLARYMFLKSCAERKIDPTVEFYRLAGSLYNPICKSDRFNTDLDSPDEMDE